MGSATSKRGILLTTVGIAFATTAIVTTSACATSTPSLGGGGGMSSDTGSGSDASAGSGGSTTTVDPAWLTPPGISGQIVVPEGATVAAHLRGIGVQIYGCTAAGSGAAGAGGGTGTPTHAWTLTAPEAQLLDAGGSQVGTHSAGPTWTSSTDGSAVVGMKVSQADAPVGSAIPWLLLRAKSTSGTGIFSAITFIQRVNTAGGKAPATGCDSSTVGAESRVDYTADYFFFQGGVSQPASGGVSTP